MSARAFAALTDHFAERLAVFRLCPILITAGYAVTRGDDSATHVPKKELVSLLTRLLQTRRHLVADKLPLAATVRHEFLMFRHKITISGGDTFEAWR